ncbi:MAG: MFS transporter, partial [Planctomycetales bacterium]|nr:MFS transporter [Planctomycetales bacterium]
MTGAAHGLDHASDEAFPPTLRAVGADFDLGDSTLGAIEALRGGFFGLLALPAGILTMRGHANGLILVSLAGIGATALLAAAAPGPGTFAVALAALGIAAGLYHPPGLTVVSTITERRGRALALHGVMGNLGIASAPLLGFLVQWGHWRSAFVALGLLGIAAGIGALRLPRVAAAGAAAHAAGGRDAGPLWVPFAATAVLLFGA